MKGAPPFSLQGFPTFFLVTYPHTVVLETLIDNVKLNFFYLSVLWNYYAYTYSFFDNISHTVCEKTAIHSLVCLLRSLLLTTFSVIVQTSSTIWRFCFSSEWPEDHKNRCLSSSKNSVGLHFHEGVEKIKENDKNTKIENLQNGRENPRVRVHLGQKLKKIIISSNFSLKLL